MIKNSRFPLFFLLILAMPSAISHDGSPAPKPIDKASMLKQLGWTYHIPIKTRKLRNGLYMLEGFGGNVAASIGSDGTVIVDNQASELIPRILDQITNLGGEKIDFVINTHWHWDHADGNIALGKTESVIISHTNSRDMMKSDNLINLVYMSYIQPAYPINALPQITFDDEMMLHFNNEDIRLMHFGAAHTTGDAAILFQESNVIHLGDLYMKGFYPFIDARNGGSIDGVIYFLTKVIEEINQDTLVIPGHGPISNYDELVDYVLMLKKVRDRITRMIKAGSSLEDVLSAGITAEWDDGLGDNKQFINRAFMSLTHRIVE
jgi:cyclase